MRSDKTARSGFIFAISCVVALCPSLCCLAYAQQVAYPEQEVRVSDLPPLTARSPHAAEVLATALEILFNDKEVCCGKNSALEDSLESADPKSLKDIASKLQGKHLLSDGRAIMVTTEYLTPDQVNAGHLIAMIRNQRPALMIWNSLVYVLYGVTYVGTVDYSSNETAYAVHKFLLQDVRFSDSRRAVTFDRLTEDATKVQGLLFVEASRP
ncbi:MAG: hypothetical protein WBQ85_20375 [Candidatus Sulfotelmatobacter sp.]